MAGHSISRRRFLSRTAVGTASICTPNAWLSAQTPGPNLLPNYVADANGNGWLGAQDEKVVRNALFSKRGFGLRPAPGFDHRADIFGRGSIDESTLESVQHTVREIGSLTTPTRRPITVAWHYGWYNRLARPPGTQTVKFKGGDYVSWDRNIETLFNDQKNEFGISVDALSWIPPRANAHLLDNYEKGYLQASNLGTRHAALLYESTLALPVLNGRIDFLDSTVSSLAKDDFAELAGFLARLRDQTPAAVFTLDDRPVVFIFGTHAWGQLPIANAEFIAMEQAIDECREAFYSVYGQFPYLIGEEMVLSSKGIIASDRIRRTTSFDAIYVYHHASNLKPTRLSGVDATLFITDRYMENQLAVLRKTYAAVSNLLNRHTAQKILVIPNLAPGFAKPGLPTLKIDRSAYADFMKLIQRFHEREYIKWEWETLLGSAALPAPIYIVGSWNEEFEGHCVFPSSLNESLNTTVQEGFDLPMAIKEAFGWNHYSKRKIAV